MAPVRGSIRLSLANRSGHDIRVLHGSWKGFGYGMPPGGIVSKDSEGGIDWPCVQINSNKTNVKWIIISTGEEFSTEIDMSSIRNRDSGESILFEFGSDEQWRLYFDGEQVDNIDRDKTG